MAGDRAENVRNEWDARGKKEDLRPLIFARSPQSGLQLLNYSDGVINSSNFASIRNLCCLNGDGRIVKECL